MERHSEKSERERGFKTKRALNTVTSKIFWNLRYFLQDCLVTMTKWHPVSKIIKTPSEDSQNWQHGKFIKNTCAFLQHGWRKLHDFAAETSRKKFSFWKESRKWSPLPKGYHFMRAVENSSSRPTSLSPFFTHKSSASSSKKKAWSGEKLNVKAQFKKTDLLKWPSWCQIIYLPPGGAALLPPEWGKIILHFGPSFSLDTSCTSFEIKRPWALLRLCKSLNQWSVTQGLHGPWVQFLCWLSSKTSQKIWLFSKALLSV